MGAPCARFSKIHVDPRYFVSRVCGTFWRLDRIRSIKTDVLVATSLEKDVNGTWCTCFPLISLAQLGGDNPCPIDLVPTELSCHLLIVFFVLFSCVVSCFVRPLHLKLCVRGLPMIHRPLFVLSSRSLSHFLSSLESPSRTLSDLVWALYTIV